MIACPSDAVEEVKEITDYISDKKGGDGAVRDYFEWLIRNKWAVCINYKGKE